MRHTHSLPRPGHGPKVPPHGPHGPHGPQGHGPEDEKTVTRTEPEICTLCDIANDAFVEPRAFVLAWKLASDGE